MMFYFVFLFFLIFFLFYSPSSNQTPAPSDWAVPMVGDMVAASYQNGWYRAQICEVNSPKVLPYANMLLAIFISDS